MTRFYAVIVAMLLVPFCADAVTGTATGVWTDAAHNNKAKTNCDANGNNCYLPIRTCQPSATTECTSTNSQYNDYYGWFYVDSGCGCLEGTYKIHPTDPNVCVDPSLNYASSPTGSCQDNKNVYNLWLDRAEFCLHTSYSTGMWNGYGICVSDTFPLIPAIGSAPPPMGTPMTFQSGQTGSMLASQVMTIMETDPTQFVTNASGAHCVCFLMGTHSTKQTAVIFYGGYQGGTGGASTGGVSACTGGSESCPYQCVKLLRGGSSSGVLFQALEEAFR